MKRKIVTVCLAAVLVIIAVAGASLAYLTDTKTAKNTFTVGNVKIELLESSLHRENAGVANGATSTSELWSDVPKEGSNNTSPYKAGDTFYTDDQIKANAREYKCEDVQLIPGRSYHKMPYVLNTGKNDAYVRIRVMFPENLVSILSRSMYTSSAIIKGEFTMVEEDEITNRDGIDYTVLTFTRVDPLKSGEMTYWNVWGTIHMNETVTNEQLDALFGEGKPYANGTFPVLVEADAIQAEGFADATAAFAAFDAR